MTTKKNNNNNNNNNNNEDDEKKLNKKNEGKEKNSNEAEKEKFNDVTDDVVEIIRQMLARPEVKKSNKLYDLTNIKEGYVAYRKNKVKAIKLEQDNYKHLYLVPSSDITYNSDDFYVLGGNSAIVYAYKLAPLIKRKANVKKDTEVGAAHFQFGMTMIRGLEKFTENMKKIGIQRGENVGDIVVFNLPTEVSRMEILGYIENEKNQIEQFNALIYPKDLYPEVNARLAQLIAVLVPKIKNMPQGYRDIYGWSMMEAIERLERGYSYIAHEDADPKMEGYMMVQELDLIIARMASFYKLGIFNLGSARKVALIANMMRSLIYAQILNKSSFRVDNEADL